MNIEWLDTIKSSTSAYIGDLEILRGTDGLTPGEKKAITGMISKVEKFEEYLKNVQPVENRG